MKQKIRIDHRNPVFCRCLRMAALFLPLLVMTPDPLMAQAPPAVGEKGQCPDTKLLEAFKRGDDDDGVYSDDGELPDVAFVIDARNAVLRRFPAPAAPKVKFKKRTVILRPLEKIELYGVHEETEFFLIRRKSENLCGWLEKNKLLEWNDKGVIDALKQDGAPGKYRVAGSPIKLKAVVHNLRVAGDQVPLFKRHALPKNVDVGQLCSGVNHKKPRHSELARCLKQFELLDIIKWVQDPVTKNENRMEKKKFFFLLGRQSVAGRDPDILGWAHEDHITVWSTRMAVFWTGKGGALYKGPQLSGQAIMNAPKGTPDRGNKISQRYPVLSSFPSSKKIMELIAKKKIKKPSFRNIIKRIQAFKTVVPGRACVQGTNKCMEADHFEKVKQDYREKVRELNNIDIVFLIDATSSMSPYFESVSNGVSGFVSGLDPDEEVELNVSVALYGDYRGQETGAAKVEYERLVPRHDPRDNDDIIERLSERANSGITMGDIHKDTLEAPFAAVLKVLSDKTRWGNSEGFRYLVHIADHGNREPGKGREEVAGRLLSSGLIENVTSREVAEALRDKGVIYVPIAVPGKTVPGANERFRDQTRKIVRRLGVKLARRLAVVKTGPNGTSNEVSGVLRESIKVKRKAFDELVRRETCSEIPGVDSKACMNQLQGSNEFVGEIAIGQLERSGLTPEVIANIKDRVESTLPGWAPPMDGNKKLLSFWLMLRTEEADELNKIVNKLCKAFRPGNISGAKRDLKKAMEDAIKLTVGDDGGNRGIDSIGQAMEKAFFIPGWALSDILGKPFPVLNKLISRLRPSGAKRWNRHFCRSAFLLDKAINQNKRIAPELSGTLFKNSGHWDSDKKRYVFSIPPEAESVFDWKYDFGKEQIYYFIPFDFIP